MPSSTERHELAERLHDGPQQYVTAIRLLADAARKALDAGDLGRRPALARPDRGHGR